jgi:hypothetical protein
VLSRTYQLAVVEDSAAARIDPENRLLWRANRRRVEAEVLRDAMLQVSGRLERRMGGSEVADLGEFAINNGSKGGLNTDGNARRSIYLPVLRAYLPPLFEGFDFADPDICTGKRNTTTVPTQALFLMNSPMVMDQARHAARRLLAENKDDVTRLALLYRRALGRTPTTAEREAALRFVHEQQRLRPARTGDNFEGLPVNGGWPAGAGLCADITTPFVLPHTSPDFYLSPRAAAELNAWAGVCQAIFGCTEFRYVE